MHVCVKENDVNANASGCVLNGYFFDEADVKNPNDSEWENMARNWSDIEEDNDIKEDEL